MKTAICALVYMQMKKALVFLSLLGLVGIADLIVNLNSMPVRAQEVKAKGYLPLAHLMNDAMQVHHTKLWFSGNAKNWALAAYELKKIKDTFEEVKESIIDLQNSSPEWRSLPIGEISQTSISISVLWIKPSRRRTQSDLILPTVSSPALVTLAM